MVTQVEPALRVRLPVGGWQVGFRVQPDGRMAVEVNDASGWLAGVVVSTGRPTVSIDSGWAGYVGGHGERRHWWALAIGHVPPGAPRPAVTFTRKTRRAGLGRTVQPPDEVDGLWVVHDGLWVGTAIGHYTHVQLNVQAATRVRCLQRITKTRSSALSSP